MDATPVAVVPPQGLAGRAAVDVDIERLQKLFRLRRLKQQLRTIRPEMEQLEAELFGEGTSCAR